MIPDVIKIRLKLTKKQFIYKLTEDKLTAWDDSSTDLWQQQAWGL